MYQALYRKWRPKTFDEVVGQEHITEILKKQVLTDRPSHAYLFTGTRGTGKTTCAKLLARAVNCLNPVGGNPCGVCDICRGIENGSILDVTEMDAASNNGVDDVRSIRDEAVYAPVTARRRVYIIDEVHMLSKPAFNALLKIMEEPPEHLIFILATTELYKVPATILSRCQRYSFRRVPPALIQARVTEVAKAEGMELTEEAASLLSRLADGALRDALSLLDQCAGDKVDRERVLSAIGLAENDEIAGMLASLLRGDSEAALEALDGLYRGGKDVASVLGQLGSLYRDLLLVRVAPQNGPNLMSGGFSEESLGQLSALADTGTLLRGLETVQDASSRLDRGGDRRLIAELCLLSLSLPPSLPAAPAPLPTAAPKAAASPAPKAEPKAAPPVSRDSGDRELPGKEPDTAAKPVEKALSQGWLKMPETASPAPAEAEETEAAPAENAPLPTWEALLKKLDETMFPPDYMLISNPANFSAKLTGDALVLYTKNEAARQMLDENRLGEIKAAAQALAGRAITVRTEEYREDAEKKLDELDRLMNRFNLN
ncbi:MAG: DNA polymerase III subunit gamma/tau [Oscillospiraceae bacterium]|nr:DNA polymerase III subunit gamma/tau [Oscillospiraceae bacterium]